MLAKITIWLILLRVQSTCSEDVPQIALELTQGKVLVRTHTRHMGMTAYLSCRRVFHGVLHLDIALLHQNPIGCLGKQC